MDRKLWLRCVVSLRMVVGRYWHPSQTSGVCMLRPVFRDLQEKRVSDTGLPGTSLDVCPTWICEYSYILIPKVIRAIPWTFLQLYICQVMEFLRTASILPSSWHLYSYHLTPSLAHECLQPFARILYLFIYFVELFRQLFYL